MKPTSESQPVTRSLEILTPPSGSSVGPGVFIYNRFTKEPAGAKPVQEADTRRADIHPVPPEDTPSRS